MRPASLHVTLYHRPVLRNSDLTISSNFCWYSVGSGLGNRPKRPARRPRRTTRAGFPATIQSSGTLRRTTAPAATTTPSPIEIPGAITQLAPIKQRCPILIGAIPPSGKAALNIDSGPTVVWSPMAMAPCTRGPRTALNEISTSAASLNPPRTRSHQVRGRVIHSRSQRYRLSDRSDGICLCSPARSLSYLAGPWFRT